ncbi:MAG: response regulator transcription factor [Chloroflexota bacterium]
MNAKILVVDDEPAVCELLAYNLRKAQYEVAVAHDGPRALQLAGSFAPDLVLLDLMLPGMDGLDVCRALRKVSDVPVIMITARDDEVDRVVGLELGADDYVCKPFSVRELLARVKAVLRRTAPGDPLQAGAPGETLHGPHGLRLDLAAFTAYVEDQPASLTRLEFDLLHLLLRSAGRVLTRERLLEQAWGYDFAGDTRAVDSAVKRLRAHLRQADEAARAAEGGGEDDAPYEWIEAVRGVGYRIARA